MPATFRLCCGKERAAALAGLLDPCATYFHHNVRKSLKGAIYLVQQTWTYLTSLPSHFLALSNLHTLLQVCKLSLLIRRSLPSPRLLLCPIRHSLRLP
jgi:hypothetical protein